MIKNVCSRRSPGESTHGVLLLLALLLSPLCHEVVHFLSAVVGSSKVLVVVVVSLVTEGGLYDGGGTQGTQGLLSPKLHTNPSTSLHE
eukprot:m.130469 g.130469  ORF g.130469 m.130469 type:complete len:88 (+) comp29482_c0_seq2:124-387(+)